MILNICVSATRGCPSHAPGHQRRAAGGDGPVAGGAAGDEPRPPGDEGRGAGGRPQEPRDIQVRPHEEEDEGQGRAPRPRPDHRGDQCGRGVGDQAVE